MFAQDNERLPDSPSKQRSAEGDAAGWLTIRLLMDVGGYGRARKRESVHVADCLHCLANYFARGDRGGVLMIRVPFPANTSSNAVVNLLSRSRIMHLTRCACSPRSMGRVGCPARSRVHVA
jgi:hypothetical protein